MAIALMFAALYRSSIDGSGQSRVRHTGEGFFGEKESRCRALSRDHARWGHDSRGCAPAPLALRPKAAISKEERSLQPQLFPTFIRSCVGSVAWLRCVPLCNAGVGDRGLPGEGGFGGPPCAQVRAHWSADAPRRLICRGRAEEVGRPAWSVRRGGRAGLKGGWPACSPQPCNGGGVGGHFARVCDDGGQRVSYLATRHCDERARVSRPCAGRASPLSQPRSASDGVRGAACAHLPLQDCAFGPGVVRSSTDEGAQDFAIAVRRSGPR